VKRAGKGVMVEGRNISILLHADYVVLIGESEDSLQNMIHIGERWCRKWRMAVNSDKTKVFCCLSVADFIATVYQKRY
jgi:hypothetical protein